MKQLLLLVALFTPSIAFAQTPTPPQPPPSPETQACQSYVLELTGQALQARAVIVDLRQQIATLQTKLAEATKPTTPEPPKKP